MNLTPSDVGRLYFEYVAEEDNYNSLVYFLAAEDYRMVKIGHTTNLRTRLKSIQANSPVFLSVMATITNASLSLERALHRKFANEHSHYEWYHLTPALDKFIQDIVERSGPYTIERLLEDGLL